VTRPGFPPPVRRHSTPIPPLPHYGGRAPAAVPYVEDAPRYVEEYDPRYDARYDGRAWDDPASYRDDGYAAYGNDEYDHGDYDGPYGRPRTNTMAVLGLVFAFVFSPLGLIFSAIGLRQVKRRRERGRGLAIAGLVVSVFLLAMGALFAVLVMPKMQEAADAVVSATVAKDLAEATGTELTEADPAADAEAIVPACDVIMTTLLDLEPAMAGMSTIEEYDAAIAGLRATLASAAAGTGDQTFVADVQRLSDDFQQIAEVAARGGDTTELENKATVDSAQIGTRCALAGYTP
jgi:hypothetical protein